MADAGPTCLITNPAAGRGRASALLAELQRRAPPGTRILETREPGHAAELAAEAIREGARRIIAAGGDGTVHEVANGILASGRDDVTFAIIPCGSMNDYAYTLGVGAWWAEARPWDELETLDADVGVIRGHGRQRFFVNGCGVGFNGMVASESRKIRRLRGLPLYVLATLNALVKHYAAPPLRLMIDGKLSTLPTLSLSIGLAQREGGFPLTAGAVLDDGLFDTLHVGAVRRWELIRHLPGMISGHLPTAHPKLLIGRAGRIGIRAEAPLCVHLDGEFFCLPSEGVTDVEIALLPRRLRVAVYRPALYGGAKYAGLRM